MSLSPDEGGDGLLDAMAQLQDQLSRAEQQANERMVTGSAAQGKVRVEVSGEFSFDRITIDPSVVDPGDLSLLEDLVLAAIRDATSQLKKVRSEAMGGAVAQALEGLFGSNDRDPTH
ncbi:MAG TPA: YbaB/EbfC family nucleoid-associated protein [Acidimicrobiales bacterium]|nr:YbaB/EbfC family nucleoid-associated protein [Acidimicrobiales bacterium]